MSQRGPGSAAATKVHRRYWRINEAAARWLSHDAQPVSRRLQWPGDAGHPRPEGGSWGTGMAYHREPAVYPGSGGALY